MGDPWQAGNNIALGYVVGSFIAWPIIFSSIRLNFWKSKFDKLYLEKNCVSNHVLT